MNGWGLADSLQWRWMIAGFDCIRERFQWEMMTNSKRGTDIYRFYSGQFLFNSRRILYKPNGTSLVGVHAWRFELLSFVTHLSIITSKLQVTLIVVMGHNSYLVYLLVSQCRRCSLAVVVVVVLAVACNVVVDNAVVRVRMVVGGCST